MTNLSDPGVARAASGNRVALSLRGVSKSFGSFTANDRVDLDVAWGEIHALLGENGAGKTTLMRIVTGLYEPDAGSISLDGEPVRFRTPDHALRAGIGMVHQHFTLVPTLTELENLALRPAWMPWHDGRADARRAAETVASTTGLRVNYERLVGDASVGEQQRLEIVKLLCRGTRVLIFDEPSAALSPGEWDELAALMRRLAANGNAIVLISHKLSEIFAVADRFTVLRGGRVAGSGAVSDVTPQQLVTMMVGEAPAPTRERVQVKPGSEVLAITKLSVPRPGARPDAAPALGPLDLTVRAGEIVGIAGVAGSGQDELVEAILGVRPAIGDVWIGGETSSRRTPRNYFDRGGALIPENRHRHAIVESMTVWENIQLRALRGRPLLRNGVIDIAAARANSRALMTEFDVRAESESAIMGRLSGGNQQKAVLAREFAGRPALLIAVQPVRGLDVRATEFVYRTLDEHRRAGVGILLISMDLDEVMAMSDRIIVLAHGRSRGELAREDASRAAIGALMTSTEAA